MEVPLSPMHASGEIRICMMEKTAAVAQKWLSSVATEVLFPLHEKKGIEQYRGWVARFALIDTLLLSHMYINSPLYLPCVCVCLCVHGCACVRTCNCRRRE